MAKKPDAIATTDPAPVEAANMSRLLELAVDKNITPEGLEKLVALHERIADRQAAQEFTAALAGFQAACPPIAKTSTAVITQRSGARYSYQYAELDQIANVVRPLLHSRGLVFTWDSSTTDSNVECTCTLRHALGHAITAAFSCPVDTAAKMSGAQKAASALTYAKRQALVQVLGITTAEPDNDASNDESCTKEQKAKIEALIQESGADRERFVTYMGCAIIDIPQRDFHVAVTALEAKLAKKHEGANPSPGTPDEFFEAEASGDPA